MQANSVVLMILMLCSGSTQACSGLAQVGSVPIYPPSDLLVNTIPSLTKISAFWSINRIWSVTT